MKLQVPFIQLPLQFDIARLAGEVENLCAAQWQEHPLKFAGNYSLPLIAADGDPDNGAMAGPMRPTPWLERCPYIAQVLLHLGAVWGRTRLLKLEPGAKVTRHVDINYYWREHMRVHVPILTQPGVRYRCGDTEVHMGAGECWIFDTWSPHSVINVCDRVRVHLVADTVGGDRFLDLVRQGKTLNQPHADGWHSESFAGDDSQPIAQLMLESVNVPVVMTPWELREHLGFLLAHVQRNSRLATVQQSAMRFVASWQALWVQFGDTPPGWPCYRTVLDLFDTWVHAHGGGLKLVNGMGLADTWHAMIGSVALGVKARAATPRPAHPATANAGRRPLAQPSLERTIFIVSPPRSGSTLLFETLAQASHIYTIGDESHGVIEFEVASGKLAPAAREYQSNRLEATDATPEVADELKQRYYAALHDRHGVRADGPVRMLEKTPKNALRVPFLAKAFPDAQFVYLYRDPREILASMLEAWESGCFRTYPNLPGWTGLPWSMLLVPGWHDLIGKSLPEVVAAQWDITTRILLDDLECLPLGRCVAIRYGRFVANPDFEIRRLCARLEVDWDIASGIELPTARYTVSVPRPGKWRAREQEVLPQLATLASTCARTEQFTIKAGLT